MSQTNDAPRPAPSAAQWHLRISDGTVFGPVTPDDLRGWAEQGRIVPGHEVSEDGQNWTPAERLPLLEMVWKVQVEGGEIGPVNIRAIADLLRDGTASPDTRIVNTITGETATVAQKQALIGFESAPEPSPQAAAEAEALRQQLHDERARHQERVAELVKHVQTLEKELKATAQQAERLGAAGVKEHERLKQAQQQNEAETARLQEKIRELEQQKQALTGTLESAEKHLAGLKRSSATGRVDWIEGDKTRAPAAGREAAGQDVELGRRIAALRKDTEEAAGRLQEAQAKLQQQAAAYAALQQQTRERETQLQERAAGLERRAAEAAALLDETRRELQGERLRHANAHVETRVREHDLSRRLDTTNREVLKTQSKLSEAEGQLQQIANREQELQAEIGKLQRLADNAAAQLAAAREDLAVEKRRHTDGHEEAGRREVALAERVAHLAAGADAAAHRLTELQSQLQLQNEDRQKLTRQAEEKERLLQAQLVDLKAAAATAAGQLAQARRELDEEKARHTDTRSKVTRKEEELVQRIDKLAWQAENTAARLRMSEQALKKQEEITVALHEQSREKESLLLAQIEDYRREALAADEELQAARRDLEAERQRHT